MIINCPHCNISIELTEIRCGIFRCGIFKKDFTQIPPHSTEEECDNYNKENLIYGCGKPFQIIFPNFIIQKCNYI